MSMMKDYKIVFSGLLGGAIFASIFAFILCTNFNLFYNYTYIPAIGIVFRILFDGVVFFCMGFYMNLGMIWLRSEQEKLFSPLYSLKGFILGTIAGGALSLIFACVLFIALRDEKRLANIFWIGSSCLVIQLLFMCVGVKRALAKEFYSDPAFRLKSYLKWIVVFWLFIFLTHGEAVLGALAPGRLRHARLMKIFDPMYSQAVMYVKNDSTVRSQAGIIENVTPALGVNNVTLDMNESYGEFTLDVKGNLGKGKAKIAVQDSFHSYTIDGNFISASGNFQLEKKIVEK